MPTWTLPVVIAVLAAAVIATSTIAAVQTGAADQARAERDALANEVADLRTEVRDLRALAEEDDGAEVRVPGDGPDLDELLDGLFDGLLGGGGPFDLLAAPGAACVGSDAVDAGGVLDGLLGGLRSSGSTSVDLDGQVAVTSEQVAELRELDWVAEVEVAFLDDDATRARLQELTELGAEERAALRTEQWILEAFGAVPAGTDLQRLQQDLLGETVAGFYVSETREVVVRVPGTGSLGPPDRITLAHELEHALADQVLGLPDRTEPPLRDDRDASRAALAMVEGDATLLMTLWTLEHLSLTEQLGLVFDPALAGQQEILDDVPDTIVRELLFPYTDGLDWACDVYLAGGWAAVDAAYADPPATTYEILFGDPPGSTAVTSLDASAVAGEVVLRTSFGAADLLWQLEAPGGDSSRALDEPRERSRAWDGGEVVVWGAEAGPVVGVSLRDRGRGGAPLCETLNLWAEAAFVGASRAPASASPDGSSLTILDGERSAAVGCEGSEVRVGLAGDAQVARSVAGG